MVGNWTLGTLMGGGGWVVNNGEGGWGGGGGVQLMNFGCNRK